MRLGIVVRMDKTGLGNQTRNLTYMLKPDKIMAIDSTPFNKNKQFLDQYSGFGGVVTRGFPTSLEMRQFLKGLDVVISCETFYNPLFYTYARGQGRPGKLFGGVKTILQYNYEFLDVLVNPNYPKADINLSPSYWKMDEAAKALGKPVVYLPPPTDATLFKNAREKNFNRSGPKRFLHIIGRQAANDRNGTLDLLDALQYTDRDFELVLKTQGNLTDPLTAWFQRGDYRTTFDHSAPDDESILYENFDAIIMPRKYGGLCLPMNEALLSGLPVIMTDISPNDKALPKKWLVPAVKEGEFMTRTMIDYYQADAKALAKKIDWLCDTDLGPEKAEAFELGYNNYSFAALKDKYLEIINETNQK